MARVKRGVTARARHKKILKATKGYKLGRKNLYRQAKQAWIKAGQHAYAHRRTKKRDFRRLWIVQISAALKPYEISYSKFINGMQKAEVKLNRKVLAELSISSPEQFKTVVEKVKAAIQSSQK